jgi:hypothetical protein
MNEVEPKLRRGERPKTPASEALNRERTELTRTRKQQAQMLLAKARGELITREQAVLQASYLMRALQQKIWYFPARYGNEILRTLDLEQDRKKELTGILKKVATEFMATIRELPSCVEEGWLDRLADDEDSEVASKAAEAKERVKKGKRLMRFFSSSK